MSDSTANPRRGDNLSARMRQAETTAKEIKGLLARFDDDAEVFIGMNTMYVRQDGRVYGLDDTPQPRSLRLQRIFSPVLIARAQARVDSNPKPDEYLAWLGESYPWLDETGLRPHLGSGKLFLVNERQHAYCPRYDRRVAVLAYGVLYPDAGRTRGAGSGARTTPQPEDHMDEYTLTVRFTRSLSEDEPVARAKYPELPLDQALIRQLRDELQEACDEGVAGEFKIEGVSIPAPTPSSAPG